jgi:hypothetical protein
VRLFRITRHACGSDLESGSNLLYDCRSERVAFDGKSFLSELDGVLCRAQVSCRGEVLLGVGYVDLLKLR